MLFRYETKDAEDNYIKKKELASGIKYAWDFIPYEELLTTIAEEKINNNLFNTTNEGLVTMTNIEDLKIYSSNGTLLISLNNQVKGQLIKLDKGFYIVKAVGDDIENSYVIIIR